jgi:methylated-DNA-[protein]-cysteine S-methyltransferase
MGAAAGEAGITRLVLPHYQMDDLLALLAWEHPKATRDELPFAQLQQLTRDYFNGRNVDFSGVACALPAEGAFSGKVLRGCRAIAWGQRTSYSALAKQLSMPDAARAIATALSKNEIPLVIPCHRVTYSDGRPGGFSAPGGPDMKMRLLALESRGLKGA